MKDNNSLFETHPFIEKVWDYEKNKNIGLSPDEVTYGTNTKAYFKCDKGHVRYVRINTITSRHKNRYNCQDCKKESNLLKDKHPELFKEVDREKNHGIDIEKISSGSSKKIWWKCKEGHSWQSQPGTRVSGNTKCVICMKKNPSKKKAKKLIDYCDKEKFELLDKNKNSYEDIKKYFLYDRKDVYFLCKNGHSFSKKPRDVYRYKVRCPHEDCFVGNAIKGVDDLFTLYPHLRKLWDFDKNKNINPETMTPGSNKKVWWKCEKGHNYKKDINTVKEQITGCPYCNGKSLAGVNDLATLYPEIAKEWDYDRNDFSPSDVVPKSCKRAWWICSIDNSHRWECQISTRTRKDPTGCPHCVPKGGQSLLEIGIYLYIKKIIDEVNKQSNIIYRVESSYKPSWLSPQEIDIFIDNINLGIEVNGSYWHNEENRPGVSERDARKLELCNQNNVELIIIEEKEWKEDINISKEKLKFLLVTYLNNMGNKIDINTIKTPDVTDKEIYQHLKNKKDKKFNEKSVKGYNPITRPQKDYSTKPKNIDTEEVVKLYKEGKTQQEIGKIVGCSRINVRNILIKKNAYIPRKIKNE